MSKKQKITNILLQKTNKTCVQNIQTNNLNNNRFIIQALALQDDQVI